MFPPGSNLASVVTAMQYLGSPMVHPATRGRKHRSLDLLAQHFAHLGSLNELTMKYSTMPVALATLDDAARSELVKELSGDRSQREDFAWTKFLLRMEAHEFRRCPICVAEDLHKYGFAFARCIHQIATITDCPIHWCALESECGQCRRNFSRRGRGSRFLLDVCRFCGARSSGTVSNKLSKGYLAFADLLYRGMKGEATEVKPDELKTALDRFSELSLVHRVDLMRRLTTFWEVKSWQDVCACIGASSGELFQSLVFGVQPRSVLAAYGLASFFHSNVACDTTLPSGQPADQVLLGMDGSTADLRIAGHAFKAGLSIDLIVSILSGDWSIARTAGTMRSLRNFSATLKQDLQWRIRQNRKQYVMLNRHTLRKRKSFLNSRSRSMHGGLKLEVQHLNPR